jgi:hypothetical protein
LIDETGQLIEVTAKHNKVTQENRSFHSDLFSLHKELADKRDFIEKLKRDYDTVNENYRIILEQDTTKAWLALQ